MAPALYDIAKALRDLSFSVGMGTLLIGLAIFFHALWTRGSVGNDR